LNVVQVAQLSDREFNLSSILLPNALPAPRLLNIFEVFKSITHIIGLGLSLCHCRSNQLIRFSSNRDIFLSNTNGFRFCTKSQW